MNALRTARRSPVTPAVLTALLLHLLGTLPQQVEWADRLTSDAGPLSALRLLTVSPTLWLTEATGAAAAFQEALWTVFFLLLLSAITTALIAQATDRAAIAATSIAFPIFAPLAHLLALACLRMPELSFAPTLRGEAARQLLMDAQAGTGHVVLIGLLGGQVALLVGMLALERRRAAAAGSSGETRDEPALRDQFRDLIGKLRRRMDTLWPRIGVTLVATAGGALVLALLLSDLPGRALEPFVRFWCAPGDQPADCGDMLREQVRGTLPMEDLPMDPPLLRRLILVYAWQAFLLLYALTYFVVNGIVTGLARLPRVILGVWAAYTAGAITFVGVLEVAISISPGHALRQSLAERFPLYGLEHALYGAPVAAAVCAGAAWAVTRLTDRRTGAAPPDSEGSATPKET